METIIDRLIFAGGIHSLGFAVFHIFFWKIFNWHKDLKKVSRATSAITQILNVQLICLFLFVAALCFFFSKELSGTPLGLFMLITFSIFWFVRLVQQFIFLRINHIMVHTLTVLFALGVIIFILPVFLSPLSIFKLF
jgi:hypothetical protein